MRDECSPFGTKNQVVDLSGCASIAIPDTGIRLLNPTRTVSKQLEVQFNIPARLAFVRKSALQKIGDQTKEIFAQRSFAVGRTETGLLIVVIVSVLTDRNRWRGGSFS